VDGLAAALKKSGARHEIHRYDAAHAFFNEVSKTAYNPAAANLSWKRMSEFLKATL
jgi:carboxymethylenebutenolidase